MDPNEFHDPIDEHVLQFFSKLWSRRGKDLQGELVFDVWFRPFRWYSIRRMDPVNHIGVVSTLIRLTWGNEE